MLATRNAVNTGLQVVVHVHVNTLNDTSRAERTATGGFMPAVTNQKSISSRISVTACRLIKNTNWLTTSQTHVFGQDTPP